MVFWLFSHRGSHKLILMLCVEDRDTIRLRGFCAYRTMFPLCIQTDVTSETLHLPAGARSISEYFHLLFAVIPTLLDLFLCTRWFVPVFLCSITWYQRVICSIAHSCITLSHWHTMPRARFTLHLIHTPVSSDPLAVFLGRSWERLWPVGVAFSFLFHSS